MNKTHVCRECSMCSADMSREGYYCCGEYFCSNGCLAKSFDGTPEDWDDHYSDGGDCYWTEWEDECECFQ